VTLKDHSMSITLVPISEGIRRKKIDRIIRQSLPIYSERSLTTAKTVFTCYCYC